MCYTPGVLYWDDFCPIIDLQFVKREEYPYEYDGYERLEYSDDIDIVYTRTLVDKGPIVQTSVEFSPCVDA